ncbi:MAG: hypothetical protein J07HB67_01710 [halophilic archaeon J07HB67]|nr:MAG: hypothetical protein J07HB67_01710 [halophilic archaeon J07HB67]
MIGSLATITGCLGDTQTGDTPDDEPTRTPTPTRTIPPYNRSLHTLKLKNRREESVLVVIDPRAAADGRTLRFELEPGAVEVYEDLDLLAEPVDVRVTVGGETTTHTPQSEGIVVVTVTPDGVEFEEVVS